jgi:hypothetical protein
MPRCYLGDLLKNMPPGQYGGTLIQKLFLSSPTLLTARNSPLRWL